jgi:hypothetical protein
MLEYLLDMMSVGGTVAELNVRFLNTQFLGSKVLLIVSSFLFRRYLLFHISDSLYYVLTDFTNINLFLA